MGNMDIGNVCTEGGVTLKTITEAKKLLTSGALDEKLEALCASKDAEILAAYRERLIQALDAFAAQFGTEREVALFSAAGRTELGGNHTDHQRGHVLAASVNLDIIAVAAMRDDDLVQVKSKGFPMDIISLEELAPQTDKKPDSAELVRGVAARFRQLGYSVKRGFDAYTESQVMQGSGLSSSAAFEVLLGNICNTFYAENQCSAEEIAEIGQFAENVYFRKPCGLMDQMASSVGGVVAIDFADAAAPQVEPVSFDFSTSGYALCIVDTGGNHADLTAEYAAIPEEMCAVAKYFGAQVLSEVSANQVMQAIPALRKACGDRAVLRAIRRVHLLSAAKRLSMFRTAGTAHLHCSRCGNGIAGRTWCHSGARRRIRWNHSGVCSGRAAHLFSGGHGGCAGQGLLPHSPHSPCRRNRHFKLNRISV